MARSVIVAAVRTPFGRLGGGLAPYSAPELGAIAIRAGLERARVDPDEVGYVVMGEVFQAGVGQAPARQAAVGAGIPKEVPADTINKVCASSVRAIEIADLMIRGGDHEVVVTGGWSRCRTRRTCSPRAASATASATVRSLTTWSSTGCSRRSTGCTWSSRRPG